MFHGENMDDIDPVLRGRGSHSELENGPVEIVDLPNLPVRDGDVPWFC